MTTAPPVRHYTKGVCAIFAIVSALISPVAWAQAGAPANPAKVLSEAEIRDLLIFNSPWDSKSTMSGEPYSFRTHFVMRRGELLAQVTRYSNNETGDSIVIVREGRVQWQDSSGGEVSVAVDHVGDLVGTAKSRTTNFSVIFKARP